MSALILQQRRLIWDILIKKIIVSKISETARFLPISSNFSVHENLPPHANFVPCLNECMLSFQCFLIKIFLSEIQPWRNMHFCCSLSVWNAVVYFVATCTVVLFTYDHMIANPCNGCAALEVYLCMHRSCCFVNYVTYKQRNSIYLFSC